MVETSENRVAGRVLWVRQHDDAEAGADSPRHQGHTHRRKVALLSVEPLRRGVRQPVQGGCGHRRRPAAERRERTAICEDDYPAGGQAIPVAAQRCRDPACNRGTSPARRRQRAPVHAHSLAGRPAGTGESLGRATRRQPHRCRGCNPGNRGTTPTARATAVTDHRCDQA